METLAVDRARRMKREDRIQKPAGNPGEHDS